MKKVTEISTRKEEHLYICLDKNVESSVSAGFERFKIIHQALPELDFNRIDISLSFLGKVLSAPLLISSMTGGSASSMRYNQIFAKAAEHFQIAMGVGSQRSAIENPELAYTFKIRQFAPDILLFANIDAVQLNYGYGLDEAKFAVEMIEADALFLHLNPIQEVLQPEGNSDFSNLLTKIEALCNKLQTPVFIKEVGCGINAITAKALYDVGVAGIDCAGLGGTSWALVEGERQKDPMMRKLATNFRDWGISTVDCLMDYRKKGLSRNIIASGGVRSGQDIFKSLALGANLTGMALPFLKAAELGEEVLYSFIESLLLELKISMFNARCSNISDINYSTIVEKG